MERRFLRRHAGLRLALLALLERQCTFAHVPDHAHAVDGHRVRLDLSLGIQWAGAEERSSGPSIAPNTLRRPATTGRSGGQHRYGDV